MKSSIFHKEALTNPAIISGELIYDNKRRENNNKNDLNKYNKVTVKTKNSKQAMRFLKEQLKNLSR